MKNTNQRKNRIYLIVTTTLILFMFQGMATAGTNNQKFLYQKNLLIVKEALKVYGQLLTETKMPDKSVENQINDELLEHMKNLEEWINISYNDSAFKGVNVGGLARAERKALLLSRVTEMNSCILGFNKELKPDSSLKDKLSILTRQINGLENE